MGNLFLSFSIAIACAFGLVAVSQSLELDSYINKILPLIPILYAIVYEVLDRKTANKIKSRTRASTQSEPSAYAAPPQDTKSLTAGRIVSNVAISFFVKFSVELCLVALFFRFSGQTFAQAYGSFSMETVGIFLRGDHPWFSGSEGVYMLALIALITCFTTGLWIGYTSRGKAILEGVLTGAAVTFILTMTNMLTLYRRIEEVTIHLADSMGYVMRAGFLVVIALQVLLYGLWSGLVQMGKEDREKMESGKKGKK